MTISEDYGKLLAALMKKDLNKMVGIDFIAVGRSKGNEEDFKSRVRSFFEKAVNDKFFDTAEGKKQMEWKEGGETYWSWVKKISPADIKYMDKDDAEIKDIANKILISASFGSGDKSEPQSDGPLVFQEFALLGIDRNNDDSFRTDRLFFIDYIKHDPITKDREMKLTRDIVLEFPLK
jgi:hypothetical protein